MKYLLVFACCVCFLNFVSAQEDSVKTDTTRIVLGKKEIKIIDSEQGTDIKVTDKNKNDSLVKKDKHNDFCFNKKSKREGGFKGHWDAFEIGAAGFLNENHEMSLNSDNNRFMSLNTDKSTTIGFNFGQLSQGIIGNSFGMVTGLRLEFNNYYFENNNTILKDKNGVIGGYPVVIHSDTINLDRSKLTTSYFTIPLIFEWQFPASRSIHKRIWVSAGIIGSIKLNSHTKVVYKLDGEKKKDKNRNDFNINMLRYGFTGRIGYDDFYVYGNYYPVQFFEKNKGPELYSYSIGIGVHLD